jgi:MFS family permease
MRDAFSSLGVVGYRRLWIAGTFAFMSTQMTFLLRGVLAWDLTERNDALGFVYLCFGVAMLVGMPLGGVAADRLENRRLLLVSQVVLFGASLLMGIAVITDVIAYWMLPMSAVAQGLAFAFYGPARVAFAAELVGEDQLGNAITLSMLSMNGTRVIAPSLAGALAGWAIFGIGGAYMVSAGFGLFALIALVRCPSGATPDSAERANPLAEIADGVRYAWSNHPLRRLIVSSFFVIMFGFSYVAFVPSLVKDTFGLGDREVGLLMSVGAIGAVLVSVFVAQRADSPTAPRIMISSGLVFGAGVFALAFAPSFGIALVIVGIVGAGTTGYQALSNTLAIRLSEDSHRGRVQSLLMLSFAGFGIAAGPLGVLAEFIGLRPAIALMGAVATAAVLAYAFAERAAARRRVGESDVVVAGSLEPEITPTN